MSAIHQKQDSQHKMTHHNKLCVFESRNYALFCLYTVDDKGLISKKGDVKKPQETDHFMICLGSINYNLSKLSNKYKLSLKRNRELIFEIYFYKHNRVGLLFAFMNCSHDCSMTERYKIFLDYVCMYVCVCVFMYTHVIRS